MVSDKAIAKLVMKLGEPLLRIIRVARDGETLSDIFLELPDSNSAGRLLFATGGACFVGGQHAQFDYAGGRVFNEGESGSAQDAQGNRLQYWQSGWSASGRIPDHALPVLETTAKSFRDHFNVDDAVAEPARKRSKVVAPEASKLFTQWSSCKEASNDGENLIDSRNLLCLLCSRKFKTVGELGQHAHSSGLHARNLTDKALVAKACVRAEKVKQAAIYRDRARERRLDDAECSVIGPQQTGPSRGERLLAGMGWEGAGLGKDSTGISNALEPVVRTPGAGLGSS
jgi:hypothetical protein